MQCCKSHVCIVLFSCAFEIIDDLTCKNKTLVRAVLKSITMLDSKLETTVAYFISSSMTSVSISAAVWWQTLQICFAVHQIN